MKHYMALIIIFIAAIAVIETGLQGGCNANNACFQSVCNALACGTIPYEGSVTATATIPTNIIQSWSVTQAPTLGTFKIIAQGGNGFEFNYQVFPGASGVDCVIVEGFTQAIRIPGEISVNTVDQCLQ